MSRREDSRQNLKIYKKLDFFNWVEFILKKRPELKFKCPDPKDLQRELKKCLEVENFELAAKIRDLIKELRNQKEIHKQTHQDNFKKRAENL
tara:strand:+ start:153 stop:428 length:276 start_codon:yes stop_codon:yes gene_type:complete